MQTSMHTCAAMVQSLNLVSCSYIISYVAYIITYGAITQSGSMLFMLR